MSPMLAQVATLPRPAPKRLQEASMANELTVVAGRSNPDLAQAICGYLGIALGDAGVSRFSEGEIRVQINQNVRGRDVFVIQSTCPPTNDNLMELLILIDALKRASAQRITAVIPYYGYARQDRKDRPRVPITAKLVANLITVAGADRVLTMDLHAGQVQGFFDIPVDNLYAINVFVEHFQQLAIPDLVVVSPDVGGIKMARAYAKRFSAHLAIVDKRRISADQAEAVNLLGDVRGKNVVLVDDLIATAGSLLEAVKVARQHGAKDIYAAITHPILSGPALERLQAARLKALVVTNSIPLGEGTRRAPITVLSVAALLGEAIKRIHHEESVSSLFDTTE